MALLTFEQAIADSEQFSKRHLLLGNGFSIACRGDIFHYGSLYDQADFSGAPEVEAVFAALGTKDFEAVIRTLESAATTRLRSSNIERNRRFPWRGQRRFRYA
ncbi:DUF4917 family protein [Sphingobium baderi]|uniref:DUF4917 domain-containing protein n=1 Tax=Sphingobium baderi TaxID=1332080 RepID=A0A0S3EYA1_9SPHN|nr:DUF4917 family protein [Sphingobium baderi]ALR20408.1 hypothetical protein ATN00_08890 [Sphingobium baderi]